MQQALNFEEAVLSSMVETHYETTPVVVCPLCLRGQLHLNKGIVFCTCGLRLDTKVLSPPPSNLQTLTPPFPTHPVLTLSLFPSLG